MLKEMTKKPGPVLCVRRLLVVNPPPLSPDRPGSAFCPCSSAFPKINQQDGAFGAWLLSLSITHETDPCCCSSQTPFCSRGVDVPQTAYALAGCRTLALAPPGDNKRQL